MNRRNVLLLLVFSLLVASNFYVYTSTKKSYRSVGYNDGSIAERIGFIDKLRAGGGELVSCRNTKNIKNYEKFLSVKATDLLFYKSDVDNKIQFCIFE